MTQKKGDYMDLAVLLQSSPKEYRSPSLTF